MRLPDVVRVMMDVRGMGQLAELKSGPECPELRVSIVLHAGEMLAHVGSTRVYAGGFASIVMDSRRDQSLKSWGFRRQSDLMDAVQARQAELLVCPTASVAFDAVTEGGCGQDTVDLGFDSEGKVAKVSPARGTDVCDR